MQFVHCSVLTVMQKIKHSILWKESAPIPGLKIQPEHIQLGSNIQGYALCAHEIPCSYNHKKRDNVE